VESLHFWRIAYQSSFVYLQSSSLCFSQRRPRRPHRPISRAPATPTPLFSAQRAAPAPRPPLRTPCWPSPCSSTSRRRRPSRHARRRACQQLLHLRSAPPSLKACLGVPLDFFYPFHRAAFPLFPSSARVLSPELRRCLSSPSTAASATSHPRSSAPAAPPPPTDAHRPAQFRSPVLDRPDHRAGELELPPPLGLAVVLTIHCLLAPAKHTTSTTSPRGSFLATSPPLSYPPATRTPSPPLGAPLPAPVRRQQAATVPLFPNTDHPHDRRELLNLFPHFPLAVGEPPHWNLNATDRHPCVTRPRT
jgi:hypothetical protein